MSPIHPFGHFFEFSATANYVTTIFDDLRNVIAIALSKSRIHRLQNDIVLYDQSFKATTATLEEAIENADKNVLTIEESLNKIRANDVKFRTIQINRKKILSKLTEENLNKTLKTELKPLFFLSGTYSVILIILCGFSELYENNALYLNMLIVIDICMFLTAIFHSVAFKKEPIKVKTLNFHWILFLSVLLGIAVGMYIHKHADSVAVNEYSEGTYVLSVFFCMLACGTAFITLVVKFLWIRIELGLNSISLRRVFTECKSHLEKISKNYIKN